MTIVIVTHRPDRLLQKNVEKECPAHLEETFVGKVTKPTFRAMLEFLNEKVVGKQFDNEAELQKTLNKWPPFAQEKGLGPHKFFYRISIADGHTIACTSGLVVGIFS